MSTRPRVALKTFPPFSKTCAECSRPVAGGQGSYSFCPAGGLVGQGEGPRPPGYPNATFGRFPTRGVCARTGGAREEAGGQSGAPLPPHFLINVGEGSPTLLTRIRINSSSSFKS